MHTYIKLTVFSILLWVIGVLFSIQSHAADVVTEEQMRQAALAAQRDHPGQEILSNYIDAMSKKLKFYYTVEDILDAKTRTEFLDTTWLTPQPATSARDFISFVNSQKLPYVATVDPRNGRVVHFVHRDLIDDKKYCGNEKIDLLYYGELIYLYRTVGDALKIHTKSDNVMGSLLQAGSHGFSHVRLNIHSAVLRDVLDEAVRFQDNAYGLLWTTNLLTTSNAECAKYGYPPLDNSVTDANAVQQDLIVYIAV